MTKDFLFDDVKSEIRSICDTLRYVCSFDDKKHSCFVYGRSFFGRFVISSDLIERISSIKCIRFNSVSIDNDGRLRAFFYVV